jgi:hypothetical protein
MNDTMIRDAADYAEMKFIAHQGGGFFPGFVAGYVFESIAEAQAWCVETAKLMPIGVTLQPAKEHNGRLVGAPVSGSRVEVAVASPPKTRRSGKGARP